MVFYISLTTALLFIAWGLIYPQSLLNITTVLFSSIIEKLGWFYLISILLMLIFTLVLAFSKYGEIRLGKDNDKPEYSNISWFAMLLSAGMGIGLVFWGVAEPLFHYIQPPYGITERSMESAMASLRYSFFHWGLHPWSIYGVFGLSLAYYTFRKNKPCLISSTLSPLLRGKTDGLIGKSIDIMAVLLTLFGVASSLGLGTLQINGGLNYLLNVPNDFRIQIVIISIITLFFLLSATSGLNKGIKMLSNTNILIAASLLIYVLIFGPTTFIFDSLIATIGGYVQDFFRMSLNLNPFIDDPWLGSWTIFYWAWWISWAPFVGTFIARISKGRTVREFVIGVMMLPTLFSFIWFAVFGGTALNLQIFEGFDIANVVLNDVTQGLFVVLSHLPLGNIMSFIAISLIITFFITSADSATFVLAMFTDNGNLNPKNKIKVTWGIVESLIAVVLLLSGGLIAIQNISIIIGLPFLFIMLMMCISIVREFKNEKYVSSDKKHNN